jgi:hypothetical protein
MRRSPHFYGRHGVIGATEQSTNIFLRNFTDAMQGAEGSGTLVHAIKGSNWVPALRHSQQSTQMTVQITLPAPRDRGYYIRAGFWCPRGLSLGDVEVHV